MLNATGKGLFPWQILTRVNEIMRTFAKLIALSLFFCLLPVLPFSGLASANGKDPPQTVALRHHLRQSLHVGYTQPAVELRLRAEVSGRCSRIYHQMGESIDEKGLFLRIDDVLIRLALKNNGLAIEEAELRLADDRKTLARYRKLKERQSTAQAVFDEVLLRVSTTELALKRLLVEGDRLREELQRHLVKAPGGWTVMESLVEEQQFLHRGEEVARVGDFSRLAISFELSPQELAALKASPEISLFFPEKGVAARANLVEVAPAANPSSWKIPVELEVARDQPGGILLFGGLQANLSLTLAQNTNLFEIPLQALERRYDAHWLVAADGGRVRVSFFGLTKTGGMAIIAAESLAVGQRYLALPPQNGG